MVNTTPEKFSRVKFSVSFDIDFNLSSNFFFAFNISEIFEDFSYKVNGHIYKSKISKG